jgi:hypothetical protein
MRVLNYCVALILISATDATAQGASRVRAHVEAGLGSMDVRPLPYESSGAGTVAAGVDLPLARSVGVSLDFAATGGTGSGSPNPEMGQAGKRSLVTFRVGLETYWPYPRRGPFALLVWASAGTRSATHAASCGPHMTNGLSPHATSRHSRSGPVSGTDLVGALGTPECRSAFTRMPWWMRVRSPRPRTHSRSASPTEMSVEGESGRPS